MSSDMGSQKNKVSISSLLRVEALQETSRRVSLTNFKEIQKIEKSQEDIGWTEALCKEMDENAQEDHTCTLTKAERLRYKSNWRTVQERMVDRWLLDLFSAQQPH